MIQIPTTEDIQAAVRIELQNFFSTFQFQPQTEIDEIGKGAEFAAKITGKAIPTIYDLVHKRLIPHSKRGKDLYFSKKDLLAWIRAGKRKTTAEIQEAAQ